VAKVAVGGVLVAFVLFYILTSPNNAASMAHGIWHFVGYLAHGVGHFLDKLSS
jgi:hypothetical protein